MSEQIDTASLLTVIAKKHLEVACEFSGTHLENIECIQAIIIF